MEPEGLLPLLQKPATCHYTEQCCVIPAKNGEIFSFNSCENENLCYGSWYGTTDTIVFINIPQYRAASMHSDTVVQVFPKQLKQLTTVQYVITEKQ